MRTTAASLILAALAEGEYANDSANVAEARDLHAALGPWLAEQDAKAAVKTRHEARMTEHMRRVNGGE